MVARGADQEPRNSSAHARARDLSRPTDNGSVYTSRFTGGRNGFEYLLANLGITQKNGHPGHPQTQGKIERFHQTLKRWLAAQPAAATIAELQAQLDTFTGIYNQIRPHRALHGATPAKRLSRHHQGPPQRLSAAIRTIASVTTTSTASARSASAAAAACTTSASAPPTKVRR
jgi:transposase InsO family protein